MGKIFVVSIEPIIFILEKVNLSFDGSFDVNRFSYFIILTVISFYENFSINAVSVLIVNSALSFEFTNCL
jgi:hypothetical protein